MRMFRMFLNDIVTLVTTLLVQFVLLSDIFPARRRVAPFVVNCQLRILILKNPKKIQIFVKLFRIEIPQ